MESGNCRVWYSLWAEDLGGRRILPILDRKYRCRKPARMTAFSRMTDAKHIEEMFALRKIRPTAIRTMVLRAMIGHTSAFSLPDLEEELATVDKSTLSRTIRLFHEHHLIHSIDDGSGAVKYSVCRDDCQCALGDLHVHFHCNRCGNTYCMEHISIPNIALPEKFTLESVNFVMKGICAQCSDKSRRG